MVRGRQAHRGDLSLGREGRIRVPNGCISSITSRARGECRRHADPRDRRLSPLRPGEELDLVHGTAYMCTSDADGRIAAFPLASAARQVAYDLASRITGITDTDPTLYSPAANVFLDRLTSQSVGAGGDAAWNQTLTYDAVGNRTNETLGTANSTATTQATSNCLLSVSGFRTNTFDAMGNLVNDGAQSWTYDDRARMKPTPAPQASRPTPRTAWPAGAEANAMLTTRYAFDENGRLLGEDDTTEPRMRKLCGWKTSPWRR